MKRFGANVHVKNLLRTTVSFIDHTVCLYFYSLDGAGYFDDGTVDDFDDIENEYDEPKSSSLSNKLRLADKKKRIF